MTGRTTISEIFSREDMKDCKGMSAYTLTNKLKEFFNNDYVVIRYLITAVQFCTLKQLKEAKHTHYQMMAEFGNHYYRYNNDFFNFLIDNNVSKVPRISKNDIMCYLQEILYDIGRSFKKCTFDEFYAIIIGTINSLKHEEYLKQLEEYNKRRKQIETIEEFYSTENYCKNNKLIVINRFTCSKWIRSYISEEMFEKLTEQLKIDDDNDPVCYICRANKPTKNCGNNNCKESMCEMCYWNMKKSFNCPRCQEKF